MAQDIAVRRTSVEKALKKLGAVLTKFDAQHADLHEELRDSAIQRFEFCMDTLWKYLREYIELNHAVRIDTPNPRKVFKVCTDMGIITDSEYANIASAVEDRNLTSHTYNEELAGAIFERIPTYHQLMVTILEKCI
jgi:nucleotidyltransferase substrate binding protein (TIGR01987 family)